MICYKNIYEAWSISDRIKNNDYRWSPGEFDPAGDRLKLFTIGPTAQDDSRKNLQIMLTVARAHGQDLLIVKPSMVQVAGRNCKSQLVFDTVFDKVWKDDYTAWCGIASTMTLPSYEASEFGDMSEFHTWRNSMVMAKEQGVYDVFTGIRLTNRQEIIERMWQLGFGARRGRPLSISPARWCGNRNELELLTVLKNQHQARRYQSDMAKKVVAAFNSINRYTAWPGAW